MRVTCEVVTLPDGRRAQVVKTVSDDGRSKGIAIEPLTRGPRSNFWGVDGLFSSYSARDVDVPERPDRPVVSGGTASPGADAERDERS